MALSERETRDNYISLQLSIPGELRLYCFVHYNSSRKIHAIFKKGKNDKPEVQVKGGGHVQCTNPMRTPQAISAPHFSSMQPTTKNDRKWSVISMGIGKIHKILSNHFFIGTSNL